MKEGHIPNVVAILIISVAVFIDLSQAGINLLHFIPVAGNAFAMVANWIISAITFFMFWFWFLLYGVHFNSAKRILSMGGGFLMELIPIVDTLPAWTAAVVLVIITARMPKIVEIASGKGGVAGVASNVASVASTAGTMGAPNASTTGFDKRRNAPPADRITPNNNTSTNNTPSDGIRRSA